MILFISCKITCPFDTISVLRSTVYVESLIGLWKSARFFDCATVLCSNFWKHFNLDLNNILPHHLILLQPTKRFTSGLRQHNETLLPSYNPHRERRDHLCKWNRKPLKHQPEQVTISSDASQLGWAVVSAESHRGGAWSAQGTVHAHQLLAVILAVKTFQKDPSGISVPRQCHSSSLHQ